MLPQIQKIRKKNFGNCVVDRDWVVVRIGFPFNECASCWRGGCVVKKGSGKRMGVVSVGGGGTRGNGVTRASTMGPAGKVGGGGVPAVKVRKMGNARGGFCAGKG